MDDAQRDELLERITHICLVQMTTDGVSLTTRFLLDLHAWVGDGLPMDAPRLVVEWDER